MTVVNVVRPEFVVVVGPVVVFQHSPKAVTGEPPSLSIEPPPAAAAPIRLPIGLVVTVGRLIGVNETSLPYAVPALVVA